MTDSFTRRKFSLQIATGLGLAGIAFAAPQSSSSGADEISHTADAIHQNQNFMAPPKRVYEALMDPKQFDQITHLIPSMLPAMQSGDVPTQISPEVGGTFTLFGGHIIGRHVELVPNKRIVQAWRVVDRDPGVYSIAKFELKQLASGTKLVFDHTGFPAGLAKHLADGWDEHYWQPMHRYLA